MPFKDPEAKKAYRRAWYARPENRDRIVEKVHNRKRTNYGGVCVNCGARTVGNSKAQPGSAWCAKPECASKARQAGSVPSFLLQEVLTLADENEGLKRRLKNAEARLKTRTAKVGKEKLARRSQ